MKSLLSIFLAYMTGFLAAVPAGPVQIEVVKRSINGHLWSAMAVIAGAVIADAAYGVIALFGIAPFLQDEKVMAVFWMAGAVLLMFIAFLTIRHSRTSPRSGKPSRFLRKKRWGLIGGFSLSVSNPMMILWWLSAAKIFTDVQLIDHFSTAAAITFLAAGCMGLASYLLVLTLFLHWAKRFISDSYIQKVNLAFGIMLFVIALYFIYSSAVRIV